MIFRITFLLLLFSHVAIAQNPRLTRAEKQRIDLLQRYFAHAAGPDSASLWQDAVFWSYYGPIPAKAQSDSLTLQRSKATSFVLMNETLVLKQARCGGHDLTDLRMVPFRLLKKSHPAYYKRLYRSNVAFFGKAETDSFIFLLCRSGDVVVASFNEENKFGGFMGADPELK